MRLLEAVCEVDREASVDYMVRDWRLRGCDWEAPVAYGVRMDFGLPR